MAWDADPWHALTSALKASSGRKGKALFLPLRQALTGADHGPDMATLLRARTVDTLVLDGIANSGVCCRPCAQPSTWTTAWSSCATPARMQTMSSTAC